MNTQKYRLKDLFSHKKMMIKGINVFFMKYYFREKKNCPIKFSNKYSKFLIKFDNFSDVLHLRIYFVGISSFVYYKNKETDNLKTASLTNYKLKVVKNKADLRQTEQEELPKFLEFVHDNINDEDFVFMLECCTAKVVDFMLEEWRDLLIRPGVLKRLNLYQLPKKILSVIKTELGLSQKVSTEDLIFYVNLL